MATPVDESTSEMTKESLCTSDCSLQNITEKANHMFDRCFDSNSNDLGTNKSQKHETAIEADSHGPSVWWRTSRDRTKVHFLDPAVGQHDCHQFGNIPVCKLVFTCNPQIFTGWQRRITCTNMNSKLVNSKKKKNTEWKWLYCQAILIYSWFKFDKNRIFCMWF